MDQPGSLLEAYENSLKDGEGKGRRPSKVYAVEMVWRPLDPETGKLGRIKRWLCTFDTRASALSQYNIMKKHPVENEEVNFLVGTVEWEVEELPE